MTAIASVGQLLKRLREKPRPDSPEGFKIAEAARRTKLWRDSALSDSFWSQVEKGKSNAGASELVAMALALDPSEEEIREILHAGGYGIVYDVLVNIRAERRGHPQGARAGILSDVTLPYDKRERLLGHLEDILAGLEAQERAPAAPASEVGEQAT